MLSPPRNALPPYTVRESRALEWAARSRVSCPNGSCVISCASGWPARGKAFQEHPGGLWEGLTNNCLCVQWPGRVLTALLGCLWGFRHKFGRVELPLGGGALSPEGGRLCWALHSLYTLALVKDSFIFFFNVTEQNFYYISEISELFCALKSFKDSCRRFS